MRTRLLILGLTAGLGMAVSAQVRPPASVASAAEERAKDLALHKYGEALADHSKVILGASYGEGRAIRQWDLAVRDWKKEKGAGAHALLAEGVLFDCLSRLHNIVTPVLSSEESVPYFLDLAARRPMRASKAFQAALKIDGNLAEARFRDARIRADKDIGARQQLEQLGAGTGVIAYLAAIGRAETARAFSDAGGAQRWYERAAALRPMALVPQIGLAALSPGTAIPFDALDHTDTYYTYPCVILTAPIDTELALRISHGARR